MPALTPWVSNLDMDFFMFSYLNPFLEQQPLEWEIASDTPSPWHILLRTSKKVRNNDELTHTKPTRYEPIERATYGKSKRQDKWWDSYWIGFEMPIPRDALLHCSIYPHWVTIIKGKNIYWRALKCFKKDNFQNHIGAQPKPLLQLIRQDAQFFTSSFI